MDKPDEFAPVRAELLNNLEALRRAVAATATLSTVLDNAWFDAVEAEIKTTSPPRPATADPSGFLYDFCHPLRGADWFERSQQLAIDGRREEISDDAKFALAFTGLDPILTTQQVIPNFVGVFSVDPNVEIDQVVKKLRKKVAEGRQLALAKGRPAVLFLARTHLGADRESATIALKECFNDADFAALSGVVVADSWRLFVTEWYPGLKPDAPLTEREAEAFKSWYARRD